MQEELFQNETIEEQYISGEVLSIYFSNPSNFYKVMLVQIEDTNTSVTESQTVVTGNFGQIQEGDHYQFFGKWTDHPKYGLQFQAHKYMKEKPSSKEAVITYLSSPRFKGIGKKTAELIVDTLGTDCIDKILEDETVLDQVPQLNKIKKETLLSVIEKEQGMQKIIIALNNFGLSNRLAYKVYQRFEGKALITIQENPYVLIEEIDGIGFNRADSIAEEMGIEGDSPERIKAGIAYTLNEQTMKAGDTYVKADFLVKESIKVLEKSRPFIIAPDLIAESVISLVQEQTIIQEEGRFYVPSLYASEWGIATAIDRLQKDSKESKVKPSVIDKKIKAFEKDSGLTFGQSQKEAIKEALLSPFFILTGGPGTGKTTVLDVIVSIFADLEEIELDPSEYVNEPFPILLAAPTGRAAKRMKEMTGLPASTIHRLLGLTGSDDDELQETERTLKGSLLIIDEMSMVDTWLAYQLLKAVPAGMKVIMVGDRDQLPSVGPGQVLRDLLEGECIPSKELTEIYRQGDDSSIIQLAHEMKQGTLSTDFTQKKADRNFFPCRTNQVQEVVSLLVSKAIEKGFTAQDIQVLAPMYKGPAGIDNLNHLLQELFNPKEAGKKEVKAFDTVFRIGDKVLQLVNDPERNVFNGDMGIITGIVSPKESSANVEELVVDFDGIEVNYLRNEWNKITLSYCCSIHKSQGSEYDMVILPLVFGYGRMLKKDIVYTAITRASKTLLLCGEIAAFEKSISENTTLRQTSLNERLWTLVEDEQGFKSEESTEKTKQEIKPPKNRFVLTPADVMEETISPMIGMDGIQP
ncbi:ATP-dependent RecD-like DNA helicase [Alkalibacterium iburiense]|uniref:ATP-dependent RecD2 DNA helicase n=1 Tax=Alkalibacterium iburiense TaxID=290589 RepID=A0ABP3H956_9LACT